MSEKAKATHNTFCNYEVEKGKIITDQNSTETDRTETKRNSYIRIIKSNISNGIGIAFLKERRNIHYGKLGKGNYDTSQ